MYKSCMDTRGVHFTDTVMHGNIPNIVQLFTYEMSHQTVNNLIFK